jgi:hypothetical protein
MGASSSKVIQLPPALDVPDDDDAAYEVLTMKYAKGGEGESEGKRERRVSVSSDTIGD